MSTTLTLADFKRAVEGRDAPTLIGFYADDATVRIIDRDHPPSSPRELRGKDAIADYYNDVCSRAMTHQVETGIADNAHLAFTQACTYPDGVRVMCAGMLDLNGGKIVRQTNVQAWDA